MIENKMDIRAMIVKRDVEHLSKRQIAKDMKISRNTVDKIFREYDAALASADPDEAVDNYITDGRKYNCSGRARRVITGEVQEFIDDLLKQNERAKALGIPKQKLLKQDIYGLMLLKGYNASYASVCRYIRSETKRKEAEKEAFIRIYYEPGDIVEFDWGEVKLKIGGRLIRFYIAVFTFAHSNGRWAYLFRHQDTQAFLESHRNFFRDVRGVPMQMVYDNMRVAIKEFVGDEKVPTESLVKLQAFYKFGFRFCNIRAGNEKGHVERSVDVVRRAAFNITTIEYDTIEDAQAHLYGICAKLNRVSKDMPHEEKIARVQADIDALRPRIGDIGCFEISSYKVDKWSTICLKGCHYSVPDTHVGEEVDVKVYSEKITLYQNGEKLASHERLFKPGDWSVKLEHYVNTLQQKPGAIRPSLAFHQLPKKLQHLFDTHFTHAGKDFVLMVYYAVSHGFTYEDIIKAYEALTKRGVRRISADQLKAMMHADDPSEVVEGAADKAQKAQEVEIEQRASGTLDAITAIMEDQAVAV